MHRLYSDTSGPQQADHDPSIEQTDQISTVHEGTPEMSDNYPRCDTRITDSQIYELEHQQPMEEMEWDTDQPSHRLTYRTDRCVSVAYDKDDTQVRRRMLEHALAYQAYNGGKPKTQQTLTTALRMSTEEGTPSDRPPLVEVSSLSFPEEVRKCLMKHGFQEHVRLAARATDLISKDYMYEHKPTSNLRRLALTQDMSAESVKEVATQLLTSHIHSSVCAAMFMRQDLILWIDAPLDQIKNDPGTRRVMTGKLWFDAKVKTRRFHCFETRGKIFALSPPMQQVEFVDDRQIAKCGLVMKEEILYWIDNEKPVRYLQTKLEAMMRDPFNTYLRMLIDDTDSGTEWEEMARATIIGYIYGNQAETKFPNYFDKIKYSEVKDSITNQKQFVQTTYTPIYEIPEAAN